MRGLDLHRRPDVGRSPLRAWDAADELVVAHVETEWGDRDRSGPIVVVNDAFGALVCSLADHDMISLTDSVTSELAARDNLRRHGLGTGVRFVTTTSGLSVVNDLVVDLVVIKVPKTLSLLEFELSLLRPHLRPGAMVVGAGMVRHIHRSTLAAFETRIGPTVTSLAAKKARLAFATVDPMTALVEAPPNAAYEVDVAGSEAMRAIGRPGVFSRETLDPGARLVLQALPSILEHVPGPSVIDLGCGNGVLGAAVLALDPDARVEFVDESHLAIASAQLTVAGQARASLTAADTLDHVKSGTIDLVVCNPPFHQGHTQTGQIADQMVADAHRVLRPGGHLVVVGNRHLGHHVLLARVFGNRPTTLASTPRFVLLVSERA